MRPIDVVGLVIAGALVLLGIRSLVRWLRSGFEPSSAGERVLYSLHLTARVGMWFAFAGFFAGEALTDDPVGFRWYIMVPLLLAAVQMLTALALARGSGGPPTDPAGPDDPPVSAPR